MSILEKLNCGERVTDGKLQGTVVYCGASCVDIWWDWKPESERLFFEEHRTVWTLLKPEPKLADLDLKVGDGVYDTSEQQFGVVDLSNESYVRVGYASAHLVIEKSQPASRLKKLEVPK